MNQALHLNILYAKWNGIEFIKRCILYVNQYELHKETTFKTGYEDEDDVVGLACLESTV